MKKEFLKIHYADGVACVALDEGEENFYRGGHIPKNRKKRVKVKVYEYDKD